MHFAGIILEKDLKAVLFGTHRQAVALELQIFVYPIVVGGSSGRRHPLQSCWVLCLTNHTQCHLPVSFVFSDFLQSNALKIKCSYHFHSVYSFPSHRKILRLKLQLAGTLQHTISIGRNAFILFNINNKLAVGVFDCWMFHLQYDDISVVLQV